MRPRRLLYLLHRWSGVAGCLLIVLWVASGVTMLFVGYPRLLPEERLAALPTLPAEHCCVPVGAALDSTDPTGPARSIVLTSVAGIPHYRIERADGSLRMVDAASGRRAAAIGQAEALAAAQAFLPGAHARFAGSTPDDRWTHARALDPHRPLLKVRMGDAHATLLYLSSRTGEVVLDAPLAQRGWNFVGAWLHWLYMIRDGSRDPVWTWTLIGLSALCTVTALTGALAGLLRWRFRTPYRSGARTPYPTRWMRWHHLAGLLFGALMITWMFSGLMSMNPLGMFDPAGPRPDLAAWRGGPPASAAPVLEAAPALALLRQAGFAAVELEWRTLAGQPYLLALDAHGRSRLVTGGTRAAQLLERWPDETLLNAAPALLAAPIRSVTTITAPDLYYYPRASASMYAGAPRALPVLRLTFDDPGRTLVYIDPRTGDVAHSADRRQRAGRWLFNLLHSWDLPSMLEAGLLRDGVLIGFSAGLLVIAASGCVIGWRRLRRRARRPAASAAAGPAPVRPA